MSGRRSHEGNEQREYCELHGNQRRGLKANIALAPEAGNPKKVEVKNWLPAQDVTRTPLTYLTEAQAARIRQLERLVA
jgi:hypothetical protein